jgi:GrpB-like predicted nucleotidyltransferase (UPF0157 family)
MTAPSPIEIHAYNPSWPQEFETIRADLLNILGPLALRVDHIGSTSVPGLGAKDIIDVQITVSALTDEIRQRLTEGGYTNWSPHVRDHVPLGEDETPSRWVKMLVYERPDTRRANIHIRIEGNPNQRYPLLFRNYLRAHPNSTRSIELIKREIAKRHPTDYDAYYDIKDPVYDLIWDAAQEWAARTNWSPA